jgi:autotransporter passenger strand-loop-strand repeat protein
VAVVHRNESLYDCGLPRRNQARSLFDWSCPRGLTENAARVKRAASLPSAASTALGVVVDNSASLELLGGAVASGFTVSSGGTLEIASGYVLSDYEVASGATLEVRAGGTEIVNAGSTDFNTQIVGGEQDVFGYASGATVFAGSQLWQN